MEDITKERQEYDVFKDLLESVKLENVEGKTVVYTYKDQELLKDNNGKYYLSNTLFPESEKELSKIKAMEIEKELKLKQVIDSKNRFFND